MMRTPVLTFVAGLAIASAAHAGGATEPDDLPPPEPEIASNEPKVDPPRVPGFELAAVEPGVHRPRELRVRGRPLQGTEIVVKGYVTWIYDCAAGLAPANPRASRAELLVMVDRDPRQCERSKFFLGDTRRTSRETSIWVVDVPRPPAKPERDSMSRAELSLWPSVPKLAVGDYVAVTGIWTTESPHQERNTGGLLVYKALAHAAAASTPPEATAATAPSATPDREIAVVTQPPLRPYVERAVRNASVDRLNACSKANDAGHHDAGIAACRAATQKWDGNHLAWYGAASAHLAKREWSAAVADVERAVALRPDQSMYQLYLGIALYEAERERVEQAQEAHDQPEAAMTSPPAARLDAARDALLRAVKLAPGLWRAHYYLGRLYRDLDDSRRAAEQFTRTIAAHPTYRPGYIALIELYRSWDYIDQAIAVALLGTANVPAAEAGELWYEAGMAYDANRADDSAIAAFTRAIALKPDDALSKFQRGQIYLRKADFANARRDLDDAVRSTDPRIAGFRPIAIQLLGQIDRKRRPADALRTPTCARDSSGCSLSGQ
jgi:tetratricopeptide (TPR) repeat protein